MTKTKITALSFIAATAILLTACGTSENGDNNIPVENSNAAHLEPGFAPAEQDIFNDPERMANESRSIAILNDINAAFPADSWGQPLYPDYIGGVYLDDNGRLIIMMVESESPDAREFLLKLDEWVQIREAVFSHRELYELMDWLNERADKVAEFASSWWLDTIGNSIGVQMIRYDDEETARFRAEVTDSPMISLRDRTGSSFSLPLQTNPELDGLVSMAASVATDSTVTITIRNNSSLPLITGYGHKLEYKDANEWRFIPSVLMINDVGILIEPGGFFEMTIDLQEYLHLLNPGLFRIRKDVMIDTWLTDDLTDGTPNRFPVSTLHEITAEFNWG